jgi:hypothetical protein
MIILASNNKYIMKKLQENKFNDLILTYIENQKKLNYDNYDIMFNISKKFDLSINDVKNLFGELIFEKMTLRKIIKENHNYEFFNSAIVKYFEKNDNQIANVEFINGNEYNLLLNSYDDFEKLANKVNKKIINNTIKINTLQLGILSSWMENYTKLSDNFSEEDIYEF